MTTDKQVRKAAPMARGLIDYFPDALAAVANVSYVGNEQHNPGTELHWDRSKSTDHADCIIRHLADRGTEDDDGLLHSAKVAWRALALLQTEIERDRRIDASDDAYEFGPENPADSDNAVDLDKCGTTDGVTPIPDGDFEYDEAVRLGRITPAHRYDGDWNRVDQSPGFWRVAGDTITFHRGPGIVEPADIPIAHAHLRIDSGGWVPNKWEAK